MYAFPRSGRCHSVLGSPNVIPIRPVRADTAFLVSPRFDLGWFVVPGLASAIVGAAIGLSSSASPATTGPLLWILGVLFVDVAHVWASLYRTYLDPVARKRHRSRLTLTPLACWLVGFATHLVSPRMFWGLLAYVAVFHFIKQHIGFARLYLRVERAARFDIDLVSALLWASTLGPVIWWHAHLPRHFAWFMPDDFIAGLPSELGTLALLVQVPLWVVFLARRAPTLRALGGYDMVSWLVLLPAINWHLGIVVFDDDRVFTITNVFGHGIPYLALVFVTGGRTRVAARLRHTSIGAAWLTVVLAYYGLLVALAYSEEFLWDRLVWHERAAIFGASAEFVPGRIATAVLVAGLIVPQATHYILDRFIWRIGPDNPELATQLGLHPRIP